MVSLLWMWRPWCTAGTKPCSWKNKENNEMGWKVGNLKKKITTNKELWDQSFATIEVIILSPKFSHVWLKAWPVPVTLHLSLSLCTAFLPLSFTPAWFCPSGDRNWTFSLRNCCAFPPLPTAIETDQSGSIYPESDPCVCIYYTPSIYYTQARPAYPFPKLFQHRWGWATPSPTDLSRTFPG